MTSTTRKTRAVETLMEKMAPKQTQKQTNAKMRKVASEYELSFQTLKRAYENYLNFQKIDLRKKYNRKNKNCDWTTVRAHTDTEKQKLIRSFKHQDLDTRQQKALIHEYFFGTRDSISNFLVKHKLNYNQWYGLLRKIKIPGMVGNSKVFDFSKYAKPKNMNTVFKYAKAITRTHGNLNKPLWKSAKQNIKCLDKLTKKEELIVRRLVKVLFAYTISKNSKESKRLEK